MRRADIRQLLFTFISSARTARRERREERKKKGKSGELLEEEKRGGREATV